MERRGKGEKRKKENRYEGILEEGEKKRSGEERRKRKKRKGKKKIQRRGKRVWRRGGRILGRAVKSLEDNILLGKQLVSFP